VKFAACLLLAAALLVSAEREGNFTIRFEPKAILQTGVTVPFEISVTDSRRNPVGQAEVKLYIEAADGHERKLFVAPAITAGVYLAKPIFPEAGNWKVDVEVRRNDQFSMRSLEFNVRE
jgi:hypothetical protein